SLTRAGFYYATYGNKTKGSALFSANLTSERESDLRPKELPLAQGKAVPVRSSHELADAVTDWSWLLAALALALIAFDVFWVTRRPRTPSLGLPLKPERDAGAAE